MKLSEFAKVQEEQVTKPYYPITNKVVKMMTDKASQLMMNATIDLEQYSSAEFKASQIGEAISVLQLLKDRLEAQSAIDKARKT